LQRFEEQLLTGKIDDESWTNEIDMEFIEAMEHGMPPMGGNGIGWDRFCMLFTENDSIRDVLFFPMMKDNEK
jgi:lysyl-tRNA synthetase class 2